MTNLTAAIGTFDGVHKGHKAVLSELKKVAEESGTTPTVFTFDRHPLETIAPQRAPGRLTTVRTEVELLLKEGVDVKVITFDAALQNLTARQWLETLKDEYDVSNIVLGYDNTFGCDGRRLSPEDYIQICKSVGLVATIAPHIPGISSSAIRHSVKDGSMEEAANMLGRPYGIQGLVVDGNKIGRQIGFPTANLNSIEKILIPGEGVYAGLAHIDGLKVPAMVNIGRRPTVTIDNKIGVEAHLVDWEGNLYGKNLIIEFIKRIRHEVSFPSLDQLKLQLADDAIRTKEIIGSL